MVTPMNWVAAGVAAAMSLHALPAAARINETPSPLERWKAEAEASLQRALVEPHPFNRPSEPAGVVDVAFSLGVDGRAKQVTVLHPSGYRMLDGLAMTAVRRVRTRSAVPPEIAAGRIIVARIFIAPGDHPLAASDMHEMVQRTAAAKNWSGLDRSAKLTFRPIMLAGTTESYASKPH
jgi:TonB family protein